MITKEDYTKAYFDGNLSEDPHPAGYNSYQDGRPYIDDAFYLADNHLVQGDKILELGCAKGFLMGRLMQMGFDVTGVDCSQYAVHASRWEVFQKIKLMEVQDYLEFLADDAFDVIVSRHFLCTQTDAELQALIPEMNRVAKKQVHILFPEPREDYYNRKTINEWKNLEWSNGTIFKLGNEELTK